MAAQAGSEWEQGGSHEAGTPPRAGGYGQPLPGPSSLRLRLSKQRTLLAHDHLSAVLLEEGAQEAHKLGLALAALAPPRLATRARLAVTLWRLGQRLAAVGRLCSLQGLSPDLIASLAGACPLPWHSVPALACSLGVHVRVD